MENRESGRSAYGLVTILASVFFFVGLAHASDWEERDDGDGIRIETRKTKGSSIETIRGSMDVPYGHAQVTRTLFSMKAQRQYLVGLAELKLLAQGKNEAGEPERARTAAGKRHV